MNTQLRDWYLGALGVVRYIRRDQVAIEAIASTPVETVDVATAKTATTEIATDPEQPQRTGPDTHLTPHASQVEPASKEIRQIGQLGKAPVTKTAETGTAPKTPTRPTPLVPENQDLIQFRLAFWQPSDALVVLSSMPAGIRPGASQVDMLSNLLTAIGQLPSELSNVELLDWPLSPGTDSSLHGARELLSAFLDVKFQLKPFSLVLLMGDIAASLVIDTTDYRVGSRSTLANGAETVIAHSLHAMDQDKALKRETWEAIRYLAGASG